jgi:hypothetical protein
MKAWPMKRFRSFVLFAACAVSASTGAWAQGVPNYSGANTAPGGITLVPGTVVVPGVSGSGVTGTVPLAGTVGSAGVVNPNPGLGSPAGSDSPVLYLPIRPQSAFAGSQQSTLPQPLAPGSSGPINPQTGLENGVPALSPCPGTPRPDGSC